MNNINTNFYSNQNNNISFQANLATEIKIPKKFAEKFANVADKFSKTTEHYPNDEMTLCRSLDSSFDEYPAVRLGDKISIGDYKYSHIIENLNEMFEKLSENELTKKFVRYFKVMKKEQEFEKAADRAEKGISDLRDTYNLNKGLSEAYQKRNNPLFADRYSKIAARNKAKLDSMENALKEKQTRIIGDMEIIVKDDRDLNHIPGIYRDFIGVSEIPKF